MTFMKSMMATAAVAVALAAQSAAAAPIKSLILGGYDNATVAAVKNDLLTGDARFDLPNSASANLSTLPTLSYLSQFDSVLVFTDSQSVNLTDLSNLLGNYVNAGGGVVISTFWGQQADSAGGLLNSTGYNPLTTPTGLAYTAHTLGAYTAGHPLMNGVTSLSSDRFNGDYLPGLDAGATLVASWDDGRPLAAYNAAGNVVAITLYPNVVTFGNATGDYRRLFANGLAFAAGDSQVAAVPEPATWAMMIGGFGIAGAAMRRRAKVTTRVNFA